MIQLIKRQKICMSLKLRKKGLRLKNKHFQLKSLILKNWLINQ